MSASHRKNATIAAVAATAFIVLGSIGSASAASEVKVGALECDVSPGVGLILGSSRSLECLFYPTRGKTEHYRGRVNRLGIDIGFTGRGHLTWAVFAPTSTVAPGALAGDYAGLSAQASVGVGLGANALVGGSNRTFALQPLSVEAQTGLNIAAGIAGLSLY